MGAGAGGGTGAGGTGTGAGGGGAGGAAGAVVPKSPNLILENFALWLPESDVVVWHGPVFVHLPQLFTPSNQDMPVESPFGCPSLLYVS